MCIRDRGNITATNAWWPLFNKAYEVYREPRYAWVLGRINRGQPSTAAGPVPAWCEANPGLFNLSLIHI